MKTDRSRSVSRVLKRSRGKGVAATPRTSRGTTRKKESGDAYVAKHTRKDQELMDNELRVNQGDGPRPPAQMRARPQTRRLDDAQTERLADGVIRRALSHSDDDPAVSLWRTDIGIGLATKEERSDTDQRVLVEGFGTVLLNGLATPLSPGDMVLVPRGTKVSFAADRGQTLRLWAAVSPGALTAEDVPMKRAAGVLNEENGKEFFVGEGIFILERANDAGDPAVGFDRVRAPPGITTALHQLSVDERYLITRGEGVVEVDGKHYAVMPGDVVLIPAGSAQRIEAGDAGVDFYVVTTPRFLVKDFTGLANAFFSNPSKYDESEQAAGPRAAVEAKLRML